MRPGLDSSRDERWRECESLLMALRLWRLPLPHSEAFPAPFPLVSQLDLVFWRLSPGLNNPSAFLHLPLLLLSSHRSFPPVENLTQDPISMPSICSFLEPWHGSHTFTAIYVQASRSLPACGGQKPRPDPPQASPRPQCLTHGWFYLLCSLELT